MSFFVPTQLETERLILRQFKEEDLEDIHLYFSDPVATKYTVAKSFSRLETWRDLCVKIGHWHVKGYGPYAMVEKQSNRVIGISGFWFPYDWPEAEIMWALVRQYWGKGFAREATLAVQAVAKKHLPDLPLISFINCENQRSINLALRVGATFEKQTSFRNGLWNIYRHPS